EALHPLDDVRRAQLREHGGDEHEIRTRLAVRVESLLAVLRDDEIEVLPGQMPADPVEIPRLILDQEDFLRHIAGPSPTPPPHSGVDPVEQLIIASRDAVSTDPAAANPLPAAAIEVLGCKVSRIDAFALAS